MADITQLLRDLINNNSDAKDLAALKVFHPNAPLLMVAAIAAQKNPTIFDPLLNEFANESSEVRGRSKGATPAADVPTDAVAEFFVRPNGQKYYTRKWGEEHHDVMVLRKAREKQHFMFLYGPPGTGKTALCEGAFGEELLTVVGSGDTEPGDLVGAFTQTPSGDFEWVDGPLLIAMEEGRPLLIDEIGLIDSKALSVLYGPMDGRGEYNVTANPERGIVKAKEGFFIIGATNPNAPGVRMSEALLSRFTVQAEMTTDWKLARKLGVPLNAINLGENLTRKMEAEQISWAPQFREMLAFRDIKADFGEAFAMANLLATAPQTDRAEVQKLVDTMVGNSKIKAARI